MSWLSPAFPVGAFSYSHGIEYAVEAGLVIDEATLEDWTRICLTQEFGTIGGAMLRAAYEAAVAGDMMRLSEALDEARAFVATPEFELESKAQGQAFITTLRAAWTPNLKMGAFKDMDRVLAEGWVLQVMPCASRHCGSGTRAIMPLQALRLVAFFQAVAKQSVRRRAFA